MKTFRQFPLLAAIITLAGAARGQGTFQNLNFEAATVPQSQSPGLVNTTDALPGWNAFIGTNAQSQVNFNNPSLGTTWISLLGTNGPSGSLSIEGGYSVLLQGGIVFTTSGFVPMDASISQVGLVPATAQSIQFKAQASTTLGKEVSLNGLSIALQAIFTGPNYTLYGGDVSSFAGQTVNLEFTSQYVSGSTPPNNWNIDSIIFSNQPVPEPSLPGLSALVVLLAALRLMR